MLLQNKYCAPFFLHLCKSINCVCLWRSIKFMYVWVCAWNTYGLLFVRIVCACVRMVLYVSKILTTRLVVVVADLDVQHTPIILYVYTRARIYSHYEACVEHLRTHALDRFAIPQQWNIAPRRRRIRVRYWAAAAGCANKPLRLQAHPMLEAMFFTRVTQYMRKVIKHLSWEYVLGILPICAIYCKQCNCNLMCIHSELNNLSMNTDNYPAFYIVIACNLSHTGRE